jgi:hypothetical protein
MPIDQILPLLIAERDKLNRAIEILDETKILRGKAADRVMKSYFGDGSGLRRLGSPKKRKVSAAARKRMAEGQRKRWAAIKAAK